MKKISIQDLIDSKFQTVAELAAVAKDHSAGQHYEAATAVVDKVVSQLQTLKENVLAALGDLTVEISELQQKIEELKAPKEPEKELDATPKAPTAPAAPANPPA